MALAHDWCVEDFFAAVIADEATLVAIFYLHGRFLPKNSGFQKTLLILAFRTKTYMRVLYVRPDLL